MMKTITHFFTSGFPGVMSPVKSTSGGARHSHALSAVLILLSFLMLVPGLARAEGDGDGDTSTDEVTFTYVSADPEGYANEGADKLFDGNTGTKWCFAFSNPSYVIFKASKPGIVKGYTITTGNDSGNWGCNGRNPKSWTLYGSNDQQTWTVIDQVSDDSKLQDKNSTAYDYTCSPSDVYEYFKWEITSRSSSTTMQMSEFKLDMDFNFCTVHQIEPVEAKDPTCTEAGNTAYYKCSVCGWAFKDAQGTDRYTDQGYILPAKGHQIKGNACEVCGITAFKYGVEIGEVFIKGFADGCFVPDLVIPDEIDGKPVVAIGSMAFEGSALNSVTIPASVREIRYRAFRQCSSLSSVTFAEDGKLESIGGYAFRSTALASVTIPSSVNIIGYDAFFETGSLQTVTFRRLAMGDNIASYDASMFYSCNGLTTILVPSGSEDSYKSQLSSCADKIQGQEITGDMIFGGLIYEVNEAHDGLICKGFANPSQADGEVVSPTTDLAIPATAVGCPVTGIAENAFYGTALGSVSIPSSVTTIGANAFGTVSSISFARVPSAEKSIQGYDDQFAQSVGIIYVPSGFEEEYQRQLASHASSIQGQDIVVNGMRYKRAAAKDGLACLGFQNPETDKEYLEVTIPATVEGMAVTAIEANAFKDNAKLVNASIYNATQLTVIGEGAFSGTGISTLDAPASVTTIGANAFKDTKKLRYVRFATDTQLKEIGEGAFSGAGFSDMFVPASVTTIGANAFDACQELYSLRLLREAEGDDALTGYATDLLGEKPADHVKVYVLKSSKDSYQVQLPDYQSRILGCVISDGLLYYDDETNDGYVCAGFSGNSGNKINIPSEVDGHPVTAVSERAFYYLFGCPDLAFAENSNVKVIGKEAFVFVGTLDLQIPASVEVIEDGAFYKMSCSTLTFASGSKLTTIGKNAFANVGYNALEIPASVTTIGENAFGNEIQWAISLTLLREASSADDLAGYSQDMLGENAEKVKVYVPKKVEGLYQSSLPDLASRIYAFTVADGLYYRENDVRKGLICLGFSGEKKTEVVIPEEVEGLPVTAIDGRGGDSAFSLVSSVVVPASVESVSVNAFDAVSSLHFKRIPVADAGIGGYDLNHGAANYYVYVPSGCEDAYKSQLSALSSLVKGEDITADGLKYELNDAKDGLACTGFSGEEKAEITIPATLQCCPVAAVGKNAFCEAKKLEKVTLLADQMQVDYTAFAYAQKLKYILVNNDEAAEGYREQEFERYYLVVSHAVEEGEINLSDETGFAPANRFAYYGKGLLKYHRTFGTQGQYATVCLPFSVNLKEVSGTFEKVYVPTGNIIRRVEETGKDEGTNANAELGSAGTKELYILMLEKWNLDGVISAGTPFFVKLAEGKEEVTFANSYENLLWNAEKATQDAWDNMMVYDWDGHTGLMEQNTDIDIAYGGEYEPKDASLEQNIWSFNTDGSFGPHSLGTLSPFRLFLRVDDNSSDTEASAKQRVITIGVSDGTATGIQEILSSDTLGAATPSLLRNGVIYDLNGRKVADGTQDMKRLRKGIYIQNGKKVVVK